MTTRAAVPRLIAVLAAALACMALASCGGGSDDSDSEIPAGTFVGVAPEGEQNATDYARMADGGVGVVRIVFQWSSIETKKGIYDWAATDQVMADIASAGLEPLVTVFGTPGIYEKAPTDPPTSSDDTLDAWSDFLAAAAERYGEGGDFWTDFAETSPDVTAQPIREWEIWNEPNSSNFWTPKPDPEAYAELIERSSKALDKADPQAQVMSGGMFATPQSDGAIVSYDFIDQLYAQDGIDDAIDVVGVHPYGPDVDSVTSQVDDTRKALDKAGSDTGLWVTEIGWGSDPDVKNDLSETPERQASLLSDSFRSLYDTRDETGVQGVVWYTWHDSVDDTIGFCGWCASAGLVDADRDSKPSWIALTDLTGGTP
jgi:hypothetical protein